MNQKIQFIGTDISRDSEAELGNEVLLFDYEVSYVRFDV